MIGDAQKHSSKLDLDRMEMSEGSQYFPQDDIINHFSLFSRFQAQEKKRADLASGSNNEVILISHRGNAKKAPENSIAAFQQAKADGATALEFDVNVTNDGKLVVFH